MEIKDWLGEDNTLGIDIWSKKYQYQNETFEEWLDRVSGGDQEVRELIKEKKFLFAGRILANRNTAGNKTYSNCYVITPPEDNLESIFDCAKKLARTFSYGGGCGVDIGKLAPKNARVNNTAKNSSGAVSFMDLYNLTTGLIGQNGRRGALMLSIPIDHPDIEDFIDIKSDLNKITNANISVRVTDEFMRAVVADEDFICEFVRPETLEVISKTVRAKDLFHKLAEMNWNYAEPGMLFWDRIQNHTLLQYDPEFEFAGTNPCAEEPLPAGGSCLLGSINLAEFVINPYTESAKFDVMSFNKTVKIAVRALNDVLDEGLPLHPLQEQRDSVRDWRQIGLGIMGLADMLIKLGIKYGSEEAINYSSVVAAMLWEYALTESCELGAEYGSYPKFKVDDINQSDMMKPHKKCDCLRNSQLLTIAPTGTLSTMLGVSGGIEPIFANSYTRKTVSLHGEDVFYKVYTPIVKEYMELNGLTEESELPEQFIVASEIPPRERIKMQAAWQEYIDASISSTINLPNTATVEDVEDIYISAWKNGLKGVTVYRAGCAREPVLDAGDKTDAPTTPTNTDELPRGYVIPVKDDLIGIKRKLMTGCGSLHCMAFFDKDTLELQETYLSKGSTGGCNNFMTGLSRLISLSARAGVPLVSIVDQLNSCGVCPSYATRKATKNDTSPGSCCPTAVGKALLDMHKELTGGETVIVQNTTTTGAKCPTCGEPLIQEGGCCICKNCGYSKCD